MDYIVLTASEGMWLTNGETFGKTVTLPISASVSAWYEISEEEKIRLEEEIFNNNLIL